MNLFMWIERGSVDRMLASRQMSSWGERLVFWQTSPLRIKYQHAVRGGRHTELFRSAASVSVMLSVRPEWIFGLPSARRRPSKKKEHTID